LLCCRSPEPDVGLHEGVDLAAAQIPALLAVSGQRLERCTRELVAKVVVGEKATDQQFNMSL
jgi:hypothetical protein